MSEVQLPIDWQQMPALCGEHAVLEQLQRSHADGLRAALGDGDLSNCWYTNVPTTDGVERYIQAALDGQAQGRMLPFAVRAANGEVVGTTRFYELDPTVPKLNIGYTWYAKRVQRTGVNTETKLLLLTHAFETLGCMAVRFETSWFNHASRTAIARLGAKQDGVLRNDKRHSDGSPRDTVVFSIIDGEWPAVKRNLLHKLEANRRG